MQLGLILKTLRLANQQSPTLAARLAMMPFNFTRVPQTLTDGEQKFANLADRILAHCEQEQRVLHGRLVQTYRLRPFLKNRGKILINHGWTGQAKFMMGFAKALSRAGFEVLAWDFPGHGQSKGRFTNLREMADCFAQLLREEGPIQGMLAHSVGGPVFAAAMQDESLHSLVAGAPIAFVSSPFAMTTATNPFLDWLDATPETREAFEALVEHQIRQPLADIHAAPMLAQLENAFHIIHCRDDEYIPFSDAEIYMAHSTAAQLHPRSGVGHRAILYDFETINLVRKLLAPSA